MAKVDEKFLNLMTKVQENSVTHGIEDLPEFEKEASIGVDIAYAKQTERMRKMKQLAQMQQNLINNQMNPYAMPTLLDPAKVRKQNLTDSAKGFMALAKKMQMAEQFEQNRAIRSIKAGMQSEKINDAYEELEEQKKELKKSLAMQRLGQEFEKNLQDVSVFKGPDYVNPAPKYDRKSLAMKGIATLGADAGHLLATVANLPSDDNDPNDLAKFFNGLGDAADEYIRNNPAESLYGSTEDLANAYKYGGGFFKGFLPAIGSAVADTIAQSAGEIALTVATGGAGGLATRLGRLGLAGFAGMKAEEFARTEKANELGVRREDVGGFTKASDTLSKLGYGAGYVALGFADRGLARYALGGKVPKLLQPAQNAIQRGYTKVADKLAPIGNDIGKFTRYKNLGKRGLAQLSGRTLAGAGAEFAQEYAQTMTELKATQKNTPLALRHEQALEAGMMGALTGGAFGAGSTAISKGYKGVKAVQQARKTKEYEQSVEGKAFSKLQEMFDNDGELRQDADISYENTEDIVETMAKNESFGTAEQREVFADRIKERKEYEDLLKNTGHSNLDVREQSKKDLTEKIFEVVDKGDEHSKKVLKSFLKGTNGENKKALFYLRNNDTVQKYIRGEETHSGLDSISEVKKTKEIYRETKTLQEKYKDNKIPIEGKIKKDIEKLLKKKEKSIFGEIFAKNSPTDKDRAKIYLYDKALEYSESKGKQSDGRYLKITEKMLKSDEFKNFKTQREIALEELEKVAKQTSTDENKKIEEELKKVPEVNKVEYDAQEDKETPMESVYDASGVNLTFSKADTAINQVNQSTESLGDTLDIGNNEQMRLEAEKLLVAEEYLRDTGSRTEDGINDSPLKVLVNKLLDKVSNDQAISKEEEKFLNKIGTSVLGQKLVRDYFDNIEKGIEPTDKTKARGSEPKKAQESKKKSNTNNTKTVFEANKEKLLKISPLLTSAINLAEAKRKLLGGRTVSSANVLTGLLEDIQDILDSLTRLQNARVTGAISKKNYIKRAKELIRKLDKLEKRTESKKKFFEEAESKWNDSLKEHAINELVFYTYNPKEPSSGIKWVTSDSSLHSQIKGTKKALNEFINDRNKSNDIQLAYIPIDVNSSIKVFQDGQLLPMLEELNNDLDTIKEMKQVALNTLSYRIDKKGEVSSGNFDADVESRNLKKTDKTKVKPLDKILRTTLGMKEKERKLQKEIILLRRKIQSSGVKTKSDLRNLAKLEDSLDRVRKKLAQDTKDTINVLQDASILLDGKTNEESNKLKETYLDAIGLLQEWGAIREFKNKQIIALNKVLNEMKALQKGMKEGSVEERKLNQEIISLTEELSKARRMYDIVRKQFIEKVKEFEKNTGENFTNYLKLETAGNSLSYSGLRKAIEYSKIAHRILDSNRIKEYKTSSPALAEFLENSEYTGELGGFLDNFSINVVNDSIFKLIEDEDYLNTFNIGDFNFKDFSEKLNSTFLSNETDTGRHSFLDMMDKDKEGNFKLKEGLQRVLYLAYLRTLQDSSKVDKIKLKDKNDSKSKGRTQLDDTPISFETLLVNNFMDILGARPREDSNITYAQEFSYPKALGSMLGSLVKDIPVKTKLSENLDKGKETNTDKYNYTLKTEALVTLDRINSKLEKMRVFESNSAMHTDKYEALRTIANIRIKGSIFGETIGNTASMARVLQSYQKTKLRDSIKQASKDFNPYDENGNLDENKVDNILDIFKTVAQEHLDNISTGSLVSDESVDILLAKMSQYMSRISNKSVEEVTKDIQLFRDKFIESFNVSANDSSLISTLQKENRSNTQKAVKEMRNILESMMAYDIVGDKDYYLVSSPAGNQRHSYIGKEQNPNLNAHIREVGYGVEVDKDGNLVKEEDIKASEETKKSFEELPNGEFYRFLLHNIIDKALNTVKPEELQNIKSDIYTPAKNLLDILKDKKSKGLSNLQVAKEIKDTKEFRELKLETLLNLSSAIEFDSKGKINITPHLLPISMADGQTMGPAIIGTVQGLGEEASKVGFNSSALVPIRDVDKFATTDNYIATGIRNILNLLDFSEGDINLKSNIVTLGSTVNEVKESLKNKVIAKETSNGNPDKGVMLSFMVDRIFEKLDPDMTVDKNTSIEQFLSNYLKDGIRSKSKPILQLFYYGSEALNNTIGFLERFFEDDILRISQEIQKVKEETKSDNNFYSTLEDIERKVNSGREISEKDKGLADNIRFIHKVLGVNVEEFLNLYEETSKGVFGNYEKMRNHLGKNFERDIKKTLNIIAPFQKDVNGLLTTAVKVKVRKLLEMIKANIDDSLGNMEIKEDSLGNVYADVSNVPKRLFMEALDKVSKNKEAKELLGVSFSPEEFISQHLEVSKDRMIETQKEIDTDNKSQGGVTYSGKTQASKVSNPVIKIVNLDKAILTNIGQAGDASVMSKFILNFKKGYVLNSYDAIKINAIYAKEAETLFNQVFAEENLNLTNNKAYLLLKDFYKNFDSLLDDRYNFGFSDFVNNTIEDRQALKEKIATTLSLIEFKNMLLNSEETQTDIMNSRIFLNNDGSSQTSYKTEANKDMNNLQARDTEKLLDSVYKNIHHLSNLSIALNIEDTSNLLSEKGFKSFITRVYKEVDTLIEMFNSDSKGFSSPLFDSLRENQELKTLVENLASIKKNAVDENTLRKENTPYFRTLKTFFDNGDNIALLENLKELLDKSPRVIEEESQTLTGTLFENEGRSKEVEKIMNSNVLDNVSKGSFLSKKIISTIASSPRGEVENDFIGELGELKSNSTDSSKSDDSALVNDVIIIRPYRNDDGTNTRWSSVEKDIDKFIKSISKKIDDNIANSLKSVLARTLMNDKYTYTKEELSLLNATRDLWKDSSVAEDIYDRTRRTLIESKVQGISKDTVFDETLFEKHITKPLSYTYLPNTLEDLTNKTLRHSNDGKIRENTKVKKENPHKENEIEKSSDRNNKVGAGSEPIEKISKQLNDLENTPIFVNSQTHKIREIFDDLLEFDRQNGVDTRANDEETLRHLNWVLDTFIDRKDGLRFFKGDLNIVLEKNVDSSIHGKYYDEGNKVVINLGNTTNNKMSASEVYVHELGHAISFYVVNHPNPTEEIKLLQRELKGIQREFLYEIRNNRDTREKLARALGLVYSDGTIDWQTFKTYYEEYVEDLNEFFAVAISNKKVFDVLKTIKSKKLDRKKTLGDIIWDTLRKIISEIMNEDITVDTENSQEALVNLAERIGKANNKMYDAYSKYKKKSNIKKAFSTLDKVFGYIPSKTGKYNMKAVIKGLDKALNSENNVSNKLIATWALVRGFPHIGTKDEELKAKVSKVLTTVFNFSPEGILNQSTTWASRDDWGSQLVKSWKAYSDKIDVDRNNLEMFIKEDLMSKFTRPLSVEEEKDLTTIFKKTDLAVFLDEGMIFEQVYNKYLAKNVTKAQRREYMKKYVTEIRNQVKDSERSSRIIKHSRRLAKYMMTGNVDGYLLMNANNIALDLQPNRTTQLNIEDLQKEKDFPKLVKNIDKLVTLMSLDYISEKEKEGIENIMSNSVKDKEALNHLGRYIATENRVNKNKLEDEGNLISNMQKGYVRYSIDNSLEIKVATVKEAQELKKEGFEKVQIYNYGSTKDSGEALAIYVNSYSFPQGYTRGVLRNLSSGSKGFSVSSHLMAQYKDKDEKFIQSKLAGIVGEVKTSKRASDDSWWSSSRLAPVFDSKGHIQDFRFILDGNTRKKLGVDNVGIFDAVASESARTLDKVKTSEHNINFVKAWDTYYEENKNSKDIDWIDIGPMARGKGQEIWRQLPQSTKNYIMSNPLRKAHKGFLKVRSDMFTTITGHKDLRITRTDTFEKYITNARMRKHLRILEGLTLKVAGYTREHIVLKNPAIFIENMKSNFWILANYDIDPVTAIKDFMEGARYLEKYNKDLMKKVELEHEIERLPESRHIRRKQREKELAEVKEALKENPMSEFDKRGLISNIVDDVSFMDKNQENDFIDKKVNMLFDKLPPLTRKALNELLVTKDSKHYEILATLTQYSDLLSRYSLHKRLKNEKSSSDLFALLDRSFVNYSTLDHPQLKYINDIGLFRFTKYFTRIQQYISHDMLGKKLGRTVTFETVRQLLGISWASPLDAILPHKLTTFGYTLNMPLFGDINTLFTFGKGGDILAIDNFFEYVTREQ